MPPPATTTGIVDGGRAAIVSTMRFPAFGAKVVQSFIDYHRSIGFVHFYLFFDGKFNTSFCSCFQYTMFLNVGTTDGLTC